MKRLFQFAGMLVMLVVVYGGFIAPLVGAWLLWDDHRTLAWVAIVGTLLGLVDYLGLPVGVALIVFARTDDSSSAFVAGVIAAIALFGLSVLGSWLVGLEDESGSVTTDAPWETSAVLRRPDWSPVDQYCRKCGSELDSGAKFCGHCGSSVPFRAG